VGQLKDRVAVIDPLEFRTARQLLEPLLSTLDQQPVAGLQRPVGQPRVGQGLPAAQGQHHHTELPPEVGPAQRRSRERRALGDAQLGHPHLVRDDLLDPEVPVLDHQLPPTP
jgi:hypothetical protein